MGRTRARSSKSIKQSKPAVLSSRPPTVSALLQKAQALLTQCDYELALRFIQRILDLDPANSEARELKGVAEIESGDLESARETFLNLVQNHSASSPPASAHLYLAQLSDEDPHRALSHYKTALDILQVQLKGKGRRQPDNADEQDIESELRSTMARALVGMVEIWMDPRYDLCFDPAAEKNCEELLSTALQTDPGNSEALQALASVRMSQQRPDDARLCLEQAWAQWKNLDLDDPHIPPIPTRVSLVKLFLELGLYTPSLLVLHGIMASDDQDVEAWYLEGWCFFLMAEEAQARGGKFGSEEEQNMSWEELAKDARDCLDTCETLHRNQGHLDEPLLEHVRELIAKLDAMGVKPSSTQEEGDGHGDDEGWEDVDSEGDGDIDMG